MMSAKNGDQVKHVFWKISATLAGKYLRERTIRKLPYLCGIGIPLSKFEQEGQNVVIPATIVDYKR
jgi:hypothetical protein